MIELVGCQREGLLYGMEHFMISLWDDFSEGQDALANEINISLHWLRS
mgnify:CR=1 FL=1